MGLRIFEIGVLLTSGAFSYLIFWENPFSTLCLFTLIMSFATLWIYRTFWLWGAFLLVFSILGYQAKILDLMAYVPIVLLGLFYFEMKLNPKGMKNVIWSSLAIGLSMLLWFHALPGFYHWKLGEQLILSKLSLPYTYWVHFDLPFIGIFALGWIVPLIRSKEEFSKWLKVGIPSALIGVGAIIFFALYFKLEIYDPKFHWVVIAHSVTTLFLVVIPQEGFLRGIVQQQFFRYFGGGIFAGMGAVMIGALFSVLLDLVYSVNFSFVLLSFFSALVYGMCYQFTKLIETGMLCHILVSLCRFILLDIPMS
jgi:membrane protease YdiL (CAAX protease family)